jgi:hypothetical protein
MGATEVASKRWVNEMLKRRSVSHEESHGPIIIGEGADCDGRGCTARMMVAVVDGRPVGLIFPASRRVVLDRLGKLLGADEVRLAPYDEVDRIFGDRKAAVPLPLPDLPSISLLMDATLLSAGALEIQSYGGEGSVRLTLEDWLATANPGLGFFTEPGRRQDLAGPDLSTDGLDEFSDRLPEPFSRCGGEVSDVRTVEAIAAVASGRRDDRPGADGLTRRRTGPSGA